MEMNILLGKLNYLEGLVVKLLEHRPMPAWVIEAKLCQVDDLVCSQIDPVWSFDLANEWRIKSSHLWEAFKAKKDARGCGRVMPVSDKCKPATVVVTEASSTDSDSSIIIDEISSSSADDAAKAAKIYQLLKLSFDQMEPISSENADKFALGLKQLLSLVAKSIKLLMFHSDDTRLASKTLALPLAVLPAAIRQQYAPVPWCPMESWKELANCLRKAVIKADYELYRLNGGRRLHRMRKKYGNHVLPGGHFCNFCWRAGHQAADCAVHREQILCFACFQFGHKNKDCTNEPLFL